MKNDLLIAGLLIGFSLGGITHIVIHFAYGPQKAACSCKHIATDKGEK